MAKKRVSLREFMLEKENKVLRDALERMRKDPIETPFNGCDNSCVVARPRGMATNGGCRCDERKLRQAVLWCSMRCMYLQATVLLLRDGDPLENFEQSKALYERIYERENTEK